MRIPVCWCGSSNALPEPKIRVNRFKPNSRGHTAQIVKCRSCGTVRMLDNGLSGDPDYEASYLYEHLSPRHERTLDLIDRYAVGDTILDIGCNTGVMLNGIRDRTPRLRRLKGIDLDSHAVEHGRDRFRLDLEAVDAADLNGSFDNIVLAHTLEHIADLGAFLDVLDNLLNTGGRLFVAVPNIASIGAQTLLGYWPGLQPAHHIWYFDHESLTSCLSSLKPMFSVVDQSSFVIWKPRLWPSPAWSLFHHLRPQVRAAWEKDLRGDQLDFVITKE